MTRLLALLGVLAILAVAAPAPAAPLEAYGKLPTLEAAAVSPSGHAVAVVLTDGEQRAIVVKDLASNMATLRVRTGDVKVRSVRWVGDKQLLVVTSTTEAPMFLRNARREWMRAFTLDIATQKVRPLLRDVKDGMGMIFGAPAVRTFKGEPTIFLQGVTFGAGDGVLSLFRIDPDTGSSRLIETGGPSTSEWIVDSEGQALGQELYDGDSGRWSLRLKDGMSWREVQAVNARLDPPFAAGLGRDGRSVLYAMKDENEVWTWMQAGVVGGPEPEPGGGGSDDQGTVRDPVDGRLIGYVSLVGDERQYVFFDPNDARIWKAVAAAYPGQIVELASWSADRRKIVVLADSPTEGPAYALVNLDKKSTSWLGPLYVDLKEGDVSPRGAVRFKAADGLDLSGYLTLPKGRTAKGLPLIVFPHGGPASRDEPGFDWWAQGMASRGYAVLQVNFRGSDGLGRRLLEAGYGQWGRKMQTDLADGIRHLSAQGTIDPKRVCIVGASYGGYAALAGATIDRDIYRCAVSVAGVSDLPKQVSYAKTRGGAASTRYWTRFMGAENPSDPVLVQLSPARLADKAQVPILLIHGQDDTIVPLEQSQAMAAALSKAGKPYEIVVQPGADHWLSRGDTRLQTLISTMAFVEKHNPPN